MPLPAPTTRQLHVVFDKPTTSYSLANGGLWTSPSQILSASRNELAQRAVVFRGPVLAAFGTDAKRMEGTLVACDRFGFTVQAWYDHDADEWIVERIEAILSNGDAPSADPRERLIESLREMIAKAPTSGSDEGVCEITVEELEQVVGLLEAA